MIFWTLFAVQFYKKTRRFQFLLAYFPKVGLCDPVSVCVSVYNPTAFECLTQSLRNLVCVSWHFSPSQWRTSLIPPAGLCVCVYRPQSLLDNGSVNTFRRQRIHTQHYKNCWTRRLLCRACRIKGKQSITSSQNFFFSILLVI
jgi:hypothetical protein